MEEIVLATRNKHKIEEIAEILKSLKIKLSSAADFPKAPDVVEDGETLEENAAKKARVIAKFTKKWALADDTGLEVEYLSGDPGVYSARYAGPGCSYSDNNKKLLKALNGIEKKKRTARFRAVIAIANPAGKVFLVDGALNGYISDTMKGRNGFGYDPLFVVPAKKKTFAELTSEEKNKISHRARALHKAKKADQDFKKEEITIKNVGE